MEPGPVLVDTNVILEAHRCGCWRALRGGHRLETVVACFEETGTTRQLRRPLVPVDQGQVEKDLKAIWPVSDRERAMIMVHPASDGLDLNDGERDLWSHALQRPDAWVLCGPDTASLRFGVRLGLRGRLVALESLLDRIGHRPKTELRRAYTTAWHNERLTAIALEEGGRRP